MPVCENTSRALLRLPNSKVYPDQCNQPKLSEKTSCSYFCRDGFMLKRSKVRLFLGDDIWTEEAPENGPTCNVLEEIFHRNVILIICARSPQVAFSKRLFARDNGSVLKAKQVLSCSENGSCGEKPHGYLAQCPSLNVPDKGLLKCNESKIDSTCTLHCFQFYQLHVAEIMTCRINGIWKEPFTKCIEISRINKAPILGYENPNDFPSIERRVQSKCTCFSEISFGISGEALHNHRSSIVDVEHFKSTFVQPGTRWTCFSENSSALNIITSTCLNIKRYLAATRTSLVKSKSMVLQPYSNCLAEFPNCLNVRVATFQLFYSKVAMPLHMHLINNSPTLQIVHNNTSSSLRTESHIQVFSWLYDERNVLRDNGFVLKRSKVLSFFENNIWTEEARECISTVNPMEKIFHDFAMPIICARSPQVAFSKWLFARSDGLGLKSKQALSCYENELRGAKPHECLVKFPRFEDTGIRLNKSSELTRFTLHITLLSILSTSWWINCDLSQ